MSSWVLYIVFYFSVQLNVQETSGGAVAKLGLLLELRPENLPSRDSVFKVAEVSGEFCHRGWHIYRLQSAWQARTCRG